jgi:uncharacterized membrane protein YedE/YeeE
MNRTDPIGGVGSNSFWGVAVGFGVWVGSGVLVGVDVYVTTGEGETVTVWVAAVVGVCGVSLLQAARQRLKSSNTTKAAVFFIYPSDNFDLLIIHPCQQELYLNLENQVEKAWHPKLNSSRIVQKNNKIFPKLTLIKTVNVTVT